MFCIHTNDISVRSPQYSSSKIKRGSVSLRDITTFHVQRVPFYEYRNDNSINYQSQGFIGERLNMSEMLFVLTQSSLLTLVNYSVQVRDIRKICN